MNFDFRHFDAVAIVEITGPSWVIAEPIREYEAARQVHQNTYVTVACVCVWVCPGTTVLDFVDCPYTLATYVIEGKTSKEYLLIKLLMLNQPELLSLILQERVDNTCEYACYQIESGE
jgi:uroporphyrinogen decarboxylase